MKDGVNVETGYRNDLETMKGGHFREMAESQGVANPGRDIDQEVSENERRVREILDETKGDPEVTPPSIQPISLGNWMFDVVADLTGSNSHPQTVVSPRISHIIEGETPNPFPRPRRPSSVHVPELPVPKPVATPNYHTHRLSLQFSPTSTVFTPLSISSYVFVDEEFDTEMDAIKKSATQANSRRTQRKRSKPELQVVAVEESVQATSSAESQVSFFRLLCDIYPTLPHKFFVFLGLFIAAASGAVTPVFSFILSKLIVQVSIGASDVSLVNVLGGIVLSLAAIDGLLLGLKYFILEKIAISWINQLRMSCFRLVLLQDKRWFDKVDGSNGPLKLVQILIKDGDDSRSLLATVIPQAIVVTAMIGTGLLWAMVRGWQLTLVGMAIAPVFVVTMAVQTNLVAKCELRNKRAREQVAKEYYEVRSGPA